jgi:hypothetical protein
MRQGCKINWANDRIEAPEVGNGIAITSHTWNRPLPVQLPILLIARHLTFISLRD